MRPILHEVATSHSPESLVAALGREAGVVLLRSRQFDLPQARYSFVTARPLVTFRSSGSVCEIRPAEGGRAKAPAEPPQIDEISNGLQRPLDDDNPDIAAETSRSGGNSEDGSAGAFAQPSQQFGNPWRLLDALMSRFELLDEMDLPFPLGGCFGYWGYDLKNFVEPHLPRRAVNDLELPDCHVGFYGSLVVFDHRADKVWIVATGLEADGSRNEARAKAELEFWAGLLKSETVENPPHHIGGYDSGSSAQGSGITSNLTRDAFIERVRRSQSYIRAGDIYQVNLAQRFSAPWNRTGWEFHEELAEASPAPFSAFLDCGEFQIASSSPELFLRLSGSHILTRPIKGTRPRSADPARDAQLTYELQTSAKEMAELVMITDLLRNDLGRVCEYGSVQVPELVRLERYAHVQHLVSTVEGRLRPDVTHFAAFASCFPGGSITGAPKIRAMEIIDELEPVTRGPYCGAIGYLGFNRESQLSIAIRSAVVKEGVAHYHAGAGIVADSVAEAEYEETLAKARGFFAAVGRPTGVTAPGGPG